MPKRSTIFALSSGRLPAAIAVVRVSGPNAGTALRKLTGRATEPRNATLVRVRNPETGDMIDDGIALWFPSPHSETGEDTVEFQLHGGHAVVAGVFDALGTIADCRPAEPGEFTRRAFENGKLDLTEVEGLADLIAAETAAQRRQAFRQLRGLIGDRAEDWRRRLVETQALVEAAIDFSDEADVPEDVLGPALKRVQELHDEIAAALADGGRGERLREGLVVAIAGPPNAGKSTLLNRLARREAAIVSAYPGTTRDVIEVHLDLGGFPVTVLDTAGIRVGDDPVEQEGVRRALERAGAADLVLWITDASANAPAQRDRPMELGAAEVWLVGNKADLGTTRQIRNESKLTFIISAATGAGLDTLVAALIDYAKRTFSSAETTLVTRARHRHAFEETRDALDRALAEGSGGQALELIAEELRSAAATLGQVTGRIDAEAVLDVIFREFCIGK